MKDPWYLSLLPWSPPRSHPVGAALANLGNTCYLNAVLQCLTHTVPLLLKLRSAACSGGGAAFCSLCALKHHIDRCIGASGGVVSPASFADNLPNLSPYLQPGRQEDAHEFLQCLLYSLHTCSDDSDVNGRSIVEQVFGGSLRSRLQCPDCGHHSDKIEPLCDISLEINDADSLTDVLRSFTKVERIGDLVICEECGARGGIEKQLKLDQAPLVMVFHLKRFKNCGSSTYKIDQFVKYPLELRLGPYLSYAEDEEESKYELYAVVVHEGSPEEGHYYCTIRSSPVTWYRMNDCKVSEVSEAIALSQKAYILFYVRRGSAPWFSSFLESQKSCQMRYGADASPVSLLDHADEQPLLSSNATCSRSRGVLLKDSNLSVETGYVASPRRLDTGGLMAERGYCSSPPRGEVGGVMAERGYTSTPRRVEIGALVSETSYAASPPRADIGGRMAERGYAASPRRTEVGGLMAERGYFSSPRRADIGGLMAERGYAASPRRSEVGGLMAERGYCPSPRRADIGGLMAERGYSASPRRADTGGLMADRGYASSPRRADVDCLKAERGYSASPRWANIGTFKADRGYVASPRRADVVSGNGLAYRDMTQATKQYSPDHVIDILHDEFADKASHSRILLKNLSFLHSEQLVDMSALVCFTVTSSLLRFIMYVLALFRRLLDVQP